MEVIYVDTVFRVEPSEEMLCQNSRKKCIVNSYKIFIVISQRIRIVISSMFCILPLYNLPFLLSHLVISSVQARVFCGCQIQFIGSRWSCSLPARQWLMKTGNSQKQIHPIIVSSIMRSKKKNYNALPHIYRITRISKSVASSLYF